LSPPSDIVMISFSFHQAFKVYFKTSILMGCMILWPRYSMNQLQAQCFFFFFSHHNEHLVGIGRFFAIFTLMMR